MSSPTTQSSSSSAASTQQPRKFYMDPALVRARVGCDVKPTNPLLQFIPECKNIDEFNEFTKTEMYRKLMDFRNPLFEPKMDPSLKKNYERLQKQRVQIMETKGYPIYAKLPLHRYWYRATWAVLLVSSLISFNNVFYVIKNH